MTIGETIRKHRLKAGLTQARLGEQVGVVVAPQKRVAEWEAGTRIPGAEYLLKLMAVLQIPAEAFDEYKEGEK